MKNRSINHDHNTLDTSSEMNGSFIEDFFGEEYRPFPGIDWKNIQPKNPGYILAHNYTYEMTAAQFVAYIPTVLADFSLESLSKLSPQDTRLLTDFLLVIDLDLLVNCFGEYILVYMYLQSYPYGRWESYLKPYIENKAHFIKGEQMIHYLDVARSALHQMRLGKDSFHVRMKNFVLLATLERKLQEGQMSPELNTPDFSFHQLHTRNTLPRGKEEEWYGRRVGSPLEKKCHVPLCYLDAPIAVGLFYQGEPVAVISGVYEGGGSFMIYQMQKIAAEYFDHNSVLKGQKVHPIMQHIDNWQDILYDTLISLLKSHGIEEICIQSSGNNERTKKNYFIPDHRDERQKAMISVESNIKHLDKKIAQQIYDVFAKKHDFEYYHYDDKNWHKKIG